MYIKLALTIVPIKLPDGELERWCFLFVDDDTRKASVYRALHPEYIYFRGDPEG